MVGVGIGEAGEPGQKNKGRRIKVEDLAGRTRPSAKVRRPICRNV